MGTVFNEQNQLRMSSLHGRWRDSSPLMQNSTCRPRLDGRYARARFACQCKMPGRMYPLSRRWKQRLKREDQWGFRGGAIGWREGPPLDTERDTELARLKRKNARLLEENEMLKETFFKAGGIP